MLQWWLMLRAYIFIFSYIKQHFGFSSSDALIMYVNHFEVRNRYGGGGSCKSVADTRARICKHFKEPRYWFPTLRAGTATLFDVTARRARLHRLAESIPWIRFLGSLNVYKFAMNWSLELSIICCKWRIIQTTIVCYNNTNSHRYCGKVKNLQAITFCCFSWFEWQSIK